MMSREEYHYKANVWHLDRIIYYLAVAIALLIAYIIFNKYR